jgi:hypothetical protein
MIWLLFPIGVFSFVMLVAISLFCAPDWPRRLAGRARVLETASSDPGRASWLGLRGLALAYLALQALLPFRHVLYAGPVNWTEEGFRFAWRVMLIEKTGHVEYEVRTVLPQRQFRILPREELTALQLKMMSTQPDMIQDYARHLADRFRASGYRGVEIRANAWVAFNGRPSQRLVDPTVDLARVPRNLSPKDWIVPLGAGARATPQLTHETIRKLSRL